MPCAEDNQEVLPRPFAVRAAPAVAPVVASRRVSFLLAIFEQRMPEVYVAGYVVDTPPPARADLGNFSAGYDPYDRFDLGSPVYGGLARSTSHLASLTAAQTSSRGKSSVFPLGDERPLGHARADAELLIANDRGRSLLPQHSRPFDQ
jgi:hypothetical protein